MQKVNKNTKRRRGNISRATEGMKNITNILL